MSKTVKWLLIILAVALLVYFIGRNVFRDDAVSVTVEKVKRTTIRETVNASGKIYPETEIRLGAGLQGEVTELLVEEGDSVKKGQLLARIKSEQGNAPNLGALGSMFPGMSAPSASSSAVTLRSPIDGVVSTLNVKRGERIGNMQMGSSEIMRVADLSKMEVRVDVNENDIIRVHRGDSVEIEVEAYSRRKFKGIVSRVSNSTQRRDALPFSADATSYEVRIAVDASSYKDLLTSSSFPFRSGMNARVEIATNKKENVLSVPIVAVTSRSKKDEVDLENDNSLSDAETIVYVVKDGRVESREVQTGIQDITSFEVVSGLKEGEQVITGPYSLINKTIPEGKKVKIVSREELFKKD